MEEGCEQVSWLCGLLNVEPRADLCRTLEAVGDLLPVVGLTVGAIILVYYMICKLTVWKKDLPPDRYGEIFWKKVDYWWIAIGSLGLIVQLAQTPLDSKVADQKMHESIKTVLDQNVNMAAARLSDSSVCLPSAGAPNTSPAASAGELARACDEFTHIRPEKRTGLVLDNSVVIYLTKNTPSELTYKNPVVTERIAGLNQAWENNKAQADKVRKAYAKVEAYKKVVEYLKWLSLALLAFAIGLRLAKVTAEIKLKNDSTKKKGAGDAVTVASSSPACELTVSANELKQSARELSASAEKINNAMESVKGAVKFEALQARLLRQEVLIRRAFWCAGGVLVLAAVLLGLHYAFTTA